jgi:hypothetical protein
MGDVLTRLVGIQAQDWEGAKWSIGIRSPEAKEQSLEQALAGSRIVRTWGFRGTLHLLDADDVCWMLKLLAPVVIAANRRRYRQLELEEATFSKSNRLLGKILEQERSPATRSEICRVLAKEGVSPEGQRAHYLLQRAALEGILCLGPARGRESTYQALPANEGSRGLMERADAEVALVERYFAGHGPAGIGDFCWWSGLPAAAARNAVARAASLQPVISGGEQLWAASDESPVGYPDPADTVLLLPPFDEYLLGYRNREAVLDPVFVKRVNAGGGMTKPTIVIGGRVTGVWKRVRRNGSITIAVEPFRTLSQDERRNIEGAAERYGIFCSRKAEILR